MMSVISFSNICICIILKTTVLQIKEAALELGYQADETFCLKISQLREIFVVRWSVFLLGPAGCGKSAIWKTLMRAQQNFGEKTFFKPINPKVSCSCSQSATCRHIKSSHAPSHDICLCSQHLLC